MVFLTFRGKSFKQRKIDHLTLQLQEAKTVNAFLLNKLDEAGIGINTWPSDNNHNIIRLSLSDLKVLEEPIPAGPQFACSVCGTEISQSEAEKSKSAKCNSCYMDFKRAQRAKAGR